MSTTALVRKLSQGASQGLEALRTPVVAGLRKSAPAARVVSERTAEGFDAVMDYLASKPGVPQTAGRELMQFGVDLVPGGPAVRTFADARELYNSGDSEQREKAKRLCVKSSLELAADGMFIGLLAIKPLRVAASLVRIGREAKKRMAANPSINVFDRWAGILVKVPRISDAADRALRKAVDNAKSAQPEKPAEQVTENDLEPKYPL